MAKKKQSARMSKDELLQAQRYLACMMSQIFVTLCSQCTDSDERDLFQIGVDFAINSHTPRQVRNRYESMHDHEENLKLYHTFGIANMAFEVAVKYLKNNPIKRFQV